jgi:hypothetical protein
LSAASPVGALHQEAQRHHDVGLIVDHQHALGHGSIAFPGCSPPVRAFNAIAGALSGRFCRAAFRPGKER